jgi:hypothetical protein
VRHHCRDHSQRLSSGADRFRIRAVAYRIHCVDGGAQLSQLGLLSFAESSTRARGLPAFPAPRAAVVSGDRVGGGVACPSHTTGHTACIRRFVKPPDWDAARSDAMSSGQGGSGKS